MRNVWRFGLSCIAVIGAIVLAPPATASASPIEVTDEINGGHCDPCVVHVVGRTRLYVMMGTVLLSDCQDEFTARIYEDGSGEIYQYSSSNYPGSMVNCLYQKCNGVGEPAAETEWPVTNPEEILPVGTAQWTARVCLDTKAAPNNGGFHCNVRMFFPTTSHGGPVTASERCFGDIIRVLGEWEREEFGCFCGHDVIEVTHL